MPTRFDDVFVEIFEAEYRRLFRYMDRLSGDPDLAADLTQEAFIRLYRRGAMPDRPGVWLITVALNLFRNAKSTSARRSRLLRGAQAMGLQVTAPASLPLPESGESSEKVRRTLGKLPEREQHMLLLRAEGYSYHDIASVLHLRESSIGTLLARAKRAFRQAYGEDPRASG